MKNLKIQIVILLLKAFLSFGGSIKCIPTNYEFTGFNEENSIPAGRFPTLNWTRDNYAEWLRLNALNMNISAGVGLAQMTIGLGQLATGLAGEESRIAGLHQKGDYSQSFNYNGSGPLSTIFGGIGKILNVEKENYLHTLEPNSSIGNVNNGDINVSNNTNGFFFYHKSIKYEYAKIIDDFFSMFGYKVNILKVPNITGRLNWNYVKLLNPNIEGTEIPEFELNEFKAQMENGITFWHNPQTFRDYSQNNNIVT